MMMKCYDRDGNPLPDEWEYGARGNISHWATDQRVGRTVIGETVVSTVSLMGIDHNYSPDGPPIIFETMIFGPGYDNDLRRYPTEEQAMRGHIAALDNVRAGRPAFHNQPDAED